MLDAASATIGLGDPLGCNKSIRSSITRKLKTHLCSISLKCSTITPTCISNASRRSPIVSSCIRFWALARASPTLPSFPSCKRAAISFPVICAWESFFSCSWPKRWAVSLSCAWKGVTQGVIIWYALLTQTDKPWRRPHSSWTWFTERLMPGRIGVASREPNRFVKCNRKRWIFRGRADGYAEDAEALKCGHQWARARWNKFGVADLRCKLTRARVCRGSLSPQY